MLDNQKILREADQIINLTFSFTSKWDMEPCPKAYQFKDRIDWNYAYREDPEWTYMLNRHQFFITLGRAFRLSSDIKYLNAFKTIISDWIKKNPLRDDLKQSTWRSIDAGIRCDYWLQALTYFESHLSESELDEIYQALYLHGTYLSSVNDSDKNHSNWSVIQNTGLYILGLTCTSFSEAATWKAEALYHLNMCFDIQLFDDGLHWEQSLSYHSEMMLCLIRSLLTAQACGQVKDYGLMTYLSRMTRALLSVHTPDGHQPLKGDADYLDITGLISLSAYVLNWSQVPLDTITVDDAFADQIDLDRLNMIKAEGLTSGLDSITLPNSGYHRMTSGPPEHKNQVLFSTGSIGGGHGHMDLLHFDLYYQGKPVLMDSGRYTYMDQNSDRYYFKSPMAHNTLIVDQQSFTDYINTWAYGKVAQPLYRIFKNTDHFDYSEAAHDGYMDLEDPLLHTRGILFIKPDIFIIMDGFRCQKSHTVSRFYNFTGNELEETSSGVTYENLLHLESLSSDKQWVEKSYRSLHYNQKIGGHRYTNEAHISGNSLLLTLIYPVHEGMDFELLPIQDRWGQVLPDKAGLALKIKRQEESWIVTNIPFDFGQNNHYKVDGHWILGRHKLIHLHSGHRQTYTYKE